MNLENSRDIINILYLTRTSGKKRKKVFNNTDFRNEIEGIPLDLPNSYWAAQHHKCAPIYYGWDKAELTVEEIREHLLG